MQPKRPKGRPPKATHLENFLSNMTEVERLIEIHTAIAGATKGRKHKVEILNKAGIILLIACWEAFVEDLAEAAFGLMLRRAKTPDVFPGKVLTTASRQLKQANDERRVWELAGDGWKKVLRSHQDETIRRYVGSLNTPRPDQIDGMFESLLGLKKVSSRWRWFRMTPSRARKELDKLVTLRGSIAHRVSTAQAVLKKDVVRCDKFVTRLAIATHNAVNAYLGKAAGYPPWDDYTNRPSG